MKTSKLAEFKVSQLSCKLLRADTVWTYFSFCLLPLLLQRCAISTRWVQLECTDPAEQLSGTGRASETRLQNELYLPLALQQNSEFPSFINTCRYNLNFSWWSSSGTSVCSLIWGSLFSGPKLIPDGCLCCAECWVNGVLPDSLQEKIRRSVGGPWAPGHEDRTSALFPLD